MRRGLPPTYGRGRNPPRAAREHREEHDDDREERIRDAAEAAGKAGSELGYVAFLVRVSASGKAILVDVAPERGGATVQAWIPISQVHEDSEVYGVDAVGARQSKGSAGRLVVSSWWASRPEVRAELEHKGIPIRRWAP